MDKKGIINLASCFVENSEDNRVGNEIALSAKVSGMRMFEAPIFAFGSAEDENFGLLKKPSSIGEHFMLPKEWLTGARTVISLFLPFTEEVKKGNQKDKVWPTEEWLHARIEGQAFINKLCQYLKSELINSGYNSVVPSHDERFWSKVGTDKDESSSKGKDLTYTSNWSERHVAFVCGLGTFGLSKGLITQKGISGRFGSIVTEMYLQPNERGYKDIYEYCSMCGACVRNCPVNAISLEKGKDHVVCSNFLDITAEKYKPRYGCGKCQTGVPCESNIP